MGMEALSLATMGHETFSESESAGDDFQNESPKKELVTMYLGGAREVTYPSQKDRALRLLEVARIVLYDFGLDWNDAYEIVMKFNQSHVSPPVDEAWVKDIVDFAWNHYWTEKDPGWRLDAEQDHFDGEYSIYNHSFILNTSKPNISAKAFLRSRCSVRGMPGLRFFQDAYWSWDGSRYIKTEESQVRSMLEEFLEMAVVRVNDGSMRFPSTMPNVLTPIMESAQRLVLLPNDIQLPYYLGAGASPEAPGTLIIGRTKTLRLRDRAVFDSQPCWFLTGTLDLDPDPYAPEPVEWNKFLGSVFGDDQLSKDLLHEFMGLVVAGDISHQKMLTMIGQTRSGKGTMGRVMEKLVGPGNYCALTVDQLNARFGLAGLPGKKLIEMNEAYFVPVIFNAEGG